MRLRDGRDSWFLGIRGELPSPLIQPCIVNQTPCLPANLCNGEFRNYSSFHLLYSRGWVTKTVGKVQALSDGT